MAEIREIKSSSPEDLDLLRRFVSECFKPSFPGDDERDVEGYFHRTQRGEFGANKPHVIVATEEGVPVGGCICVYLAEPNAGVIEYVVVRESHRGAGLMAPIYILAEQTFAEDARERGLEFSMILDEMEDPFRTPMPTWTPVDRFRRVAMAHHGGYKMVDCPYVERYLTVPGQTGVHTLILMANPYSPEFEKSVPASFVRSFVQEYFKWDERDESEGPTSYRGVLKRILDWLGPGDQPVPLFDLSDYVCCDEDSAPIRVEEITEFAGLDLGDLEGHSHLWSVQRPAATDPEAMLSFVSTPTLGFGRYLSLVPQAFDPRAMAYLCSRVEKQMIQDGNLGLGWYVQCPGEADRQDLLSLQVGFHELDVPFNLLYKPYGRPHRSPQIPVAEFLASMRQLLGADLERLKQSLDGLEVVPVKGR